MVKVVTRTVNVASERVYVLDGFLIDAIEWLQNKLDSIPEEFRNSARLDTEAYETYGDAVCDLRINYTRPETQDERAEREKIEATRKEQDRARELAEYNRLKAIYGE